ncbi:MAG: hypothetical protein VXZ40_04355 [Nanoarchaeota archaeon]|nr:hypothetical protein [Nanoarchaeota archaeon]
MEQKGYNSYFKRKEIDKNELLICPNCLSSIEIKPFEDLEYFKVTCCSCNEEIGFIKGKVKARKLGSYIRIKNKENIEKSIDISSLGQDFDTRAKDEIIILYIVNILNELPIAILNKTINELYHRKFEEIKYKLIKPKDWDNEIDGKFGEDKDEYMLNGKEINRKIIRASDYFKKEEDLDYFYPLRDNLLKIKFSLLK